MTLFHASRKKDLSVIKPQRTLSHNKYIGDYVFATKSKNMALMYLTVKELPSLMNPAEDGPNIVICADPNVYMTKDVGGAIYELPDEHFIKSPQKGLEAYEMVSTHSVTPLRKTVYSKSLQAMLSAGIEVRFVDQKTFKGLIRHPQQAELIQKLDRYIPDSSLI